MKKLDERAKKLVYIFLAIIGLIVLIIIIALIVGKFKTSSLSYGTIEDKLVSAAEEYYMDNKNALPLNETEEVEVSASVLTENGYIKDLSKYQKDKNAVCSGKVIVTKSGSFYNYSPYLDCGDKYATSYLYEKLLENVVSKDDGLYKTTQYTPSGKSETTYVYKGDYANNYVKINESLWRIVKVDGNYNSMIIENYFDKNIGYRSSWDNRYNPDKQYNVGINDYYKSIIRHNLNLYYDKLPDVLKRKIVLKDICVSSRSETDSKMDGSIECKKVIKEDYLSLLTTYDFMNASLDEGCKTIIDGRCTNYNYLLKNYDYSFWLLNPCLKKSYMAYKVDSSVYTANLSSNARIRTVTNITRNTVYAGGSGTLTDPYLIK